MVTVKLPTKEQVDALDEIQLKELNASVRQILQWTDTRLKQLRMAVFEPGTYWKMNDALVKVLSQQPKSGSHTIKVLAVTPTAARITTYGEFAIDDPALITREQFEEAFLATRLAISIQSHVEESLQPEATNAS